MCIVYYYRDMSIALITRHLNESFLHEFVEYYFSEGVDTIYILQDIDGSHNLPQIDNVNIIQSAKFSTNQLYDVNQLYTQIRNLHTWFIFVDCDEFISCVNSEQKNTIRDMLLSTYRDIDCIIIPWVMMSCNHRKRNPPSLLQGVIHRWDHNLKHPHPNLWNKGRCRYDAIEVKAIFKGASVSQIDIHRPKSYTTKPMIIDSVYHNASSNTSLYKGLHETEIAHARMLCFHYRIFSKAECVKKFKNNKLDGYKQAGFFDLWVTDYADKTELSMREKSIARFGEKSIARFGEKSIARSEKK
jgi:hypothetical protein